MEKPIVFFSHSSSDKELLAVLKQMVNLKTNEALQIFLSSDGQSIRFGKNWVFEVQQALESARIMYVFLTPRSLGSQWILFEAGFAYSKGIKVIPVGLLGVDVGAVNPPLSLLQGFNVSSRAGLMNILATLQEELHLDGVTPFVDNDYDSLILKAAGVGSGPLGRYGTLIEDISFTVSEARGLKDKPRAALSEISRLLRNNDIKHEVTPNAINMPGLKLLALGGENPDRIEFTLDPILLHVTMPQVNQVLHWCMRSGAQGIPIALKFIEAVEHIRGSFKISARLYGTSASLSGDETFEVGDDKFKLTKSLMSQGAFGAGHRTMEEKSTLLWVTFGSQDISVGTIRDLVDLLFERDVLYLKGE